MTFYSEFEKIINYIISGNEGASDLTVPWSPSKSILSLYIDLNPLDAVRNAS
jgi:hypothetical protein